MLRYNGRTYRVFREGMGPGEELFIFDLAASNQLPKAKSSVGRMPFIAAVPTPSIQQGAQAHIRSGRITSRLGIRVRVTECPIEARRPHRIEEELNDTIKAVTRLPWYTPVFLATDSEYVEQMLSSHFFDVFRVPKQFDFTEKGTRYVHRQDKEGMMTFLKEIVCLCACRRIINIGTFLNQDAVASKIMTEPYAISWTAHRR